MITVVGTWDLGWNTPIKEAELWGFVLRDFKVDAWYMSPVSGIVSGFDLVEDAQMETRIVTERARNELVFIDESAEKYLSDFTIPNNVCFVLGKAGFSPYKTFYRKGDDAIRIPTPANIAGLWPHQALAIVLYHCYGN
jgi:tRNA(Leu) C34 or U34 (ribose-2'-O)-methylase TrmL